MRMFYQKMSCDRSRGQPQKFTCPRIWVNPKKYQNLCASGGTDMKNTSNTVHDYKHVHVNRQASTLSHVYQAKLNTGKINTKSFRYALYI